MKDNTIKGVLTELQCQRDFIAKGILVSQPITQDSKYDYIVDIDNKLYKIQCKSSSISELGDYIRMKTKSTNIRTMKDTYYSSEDIDYFYTCYDDKSYLVPVEKAGHGETTLRFFSSNPKNPNIRWASDYEFDKILSQIKEEVDN